MKLFPIFFILSIWTFSMISAQNFDRSVVGVGFSPYTDNSPWRNWDQYSLDDIKSHLNVIGTYFSQISTYSMGVQQWCFSGPWDKCDSNSQVARAAAELNRDTGSAFRVNIGVYQNDNGEYQNIEINNAFTAAAQANSIASNTVWGITFTNEFVTDPSTGQRVLDMITKNRDRAHAANLKVGARLHTCGALPDGGNLQDIVRRIVQESDFIYCNVYPSREHAALGAPRAAQEVGYYIDYLKNSFKAANPNIDFRIGETGWPSAENSFNDSPNNVRNLVDYWNGIAAWAAGSRVQVQMFQAIDEPWKGASSPYKAESHYGWWFKPNNNENRFVEKATGKIF